MQDKTIGDLLARLGTLHTTEAEFRKAYSLLKEDSQFKQDISNGVILSDENGPQLLKNWCDKNSKLPITDENIKNILLIAKRYCTIWEKRQTVTQSNNNSLSLRKVKKQISSKGIEKKGQLFVTFIDNTNKALGRQKRFSYCWDPKTNDWIDSKGSEDCRGKYVAN